MAESGDLKSPCYRFESGRGHQSLSENNMCEYYERNPHPFPLLQEKLNVLLKKYYEAEWDDDEEQKIILKQDIKSLEFRMDRGESYEVPF